MDSVEPITPPGSFMSLQCLPWPASRLSAGEHFDRDGWWLLSGSTSPLSLPAGWTSLWWPACGTLAMQSTDSQWSLRAGQAQLWRGGAVRARPSHDAQWRCLVGRACEWNVRFAGIEDDAEPLPWHGEPGSTLSGAFGSIEGTACVDAAATSRLLAALIERQREVAAFLPRCRGRTVEHRRQALLRLLHVHHLMRCHIESGDDAQIDIGWLAERAHYSSGHLIRLHRDVFGETPGGYVARLRDARAWQLVRETDLPVAAITHKLGFESQSAFCRAFKHAFGMTATEARRHEDSRCAAA